MINTTELLKELKYENIELKQEIEDLRCLDSLHKAQLIAFATRLNDLKDNCKEIKEVLELLSSDFCLYDLTTNKQNKVIKEILEELELN